MTAYTDVFGTDTVPPTSNSLVSYSLSANATFTWPFNAAGATYYTASIIELTTTAGLVVTMPPANQAGSGESCLIRNLGANTFTIHDASGGVLGTVAAGESRMLYVKDNSTVAGVWSILTYGTGTSAADASVLQGLGLIAIGATLNENHPTVTVTGASASQASSDRGKLVNFTDGATTYSLLAAATATAGFSSLIRNSGSGTLTIDPNGVELIDGVSTMSVQPGESLFLVCTGTAWVTVGYGRSVDFNYTKLIKLVTPSVDINLTSAEIANKIISLTGALAADINLVFPTVLGVYYVSAEWSGAFAVTAKTALGTGVSFGTGVKVILVCDGVNIYNASTSSVAGTIAIGNGTELVPSLSFETSPATGVFRPKADALSITAAGLEQCRIDGSGGQIIAYFLDQMYIGMDPDTFTPASDSGFLSINGITSAGSELRVNGTIRAGFDSLPASSLGLRIQTWNVGDNLQIRTPSGCIMDFTDSTQDILFRNGTVSCFGAIADGSLVNYKARVDKGYSYQVPVNGFSITIPAGCSQLILNPAGVLATGTITMPAAVDGLMVSITSSQTITALTHNGGGPTLNGALTTLTANTPAKWQYVQTAAAWFRV